EFGSLRISWNESIRNHSRRGVNVQNVALWIVRAARPVRDAGCEDRAVRSFGFAYDDRSEDRSDLKLRNDLERFRAEFRREVDQVVDGRNRRFSISRGLRRHWLSRRIPFARHIAVGDWLLFDRPYRLSRQTIEGIQNSLLGRLRNGFNGAAIVRDVDQHRR